jgi:hypothetical protein
MLVGLMVSLTEKTAGQEIEGLVLGLVAVVFWTGTAIERAVYQTGAYSASVSPAVSPATVPPDSPHQWG